MTKIQFALLVLTSVLIGGPAHAFNHNYTRWGAFLKSYVEVVNGSSSRVDYQKARNDHSGLDAFVNEVEAVGQSEYRSWSENRRKAFLINSFNALIVQRVLAKNIPRSLQGTGGRLISVFDEPWFNLFGRLERLNKIEKELARDQFKTTLFAFALNHAAKGDPMLRAEPWRAETLTSQYNESVRIFLSDPSRNSYSEEKNMFEVSKIFEWYADDFVRDPTAGGSVRAFLTKYITRQGNPVPPDATIKYLPFDKSLNGFN